MLLHFIECRTSRETRNADRTQMNSWDQHKNIYKLFTMSWELSKIKGWSIFFFIHNENTNWWHLVTVTLIEENVTNHRLCCIVVLYRCYTCVVQVSSTHTWFFQTFWTCMCGAVLTFIFMRVRKNVWRCLVIDTSKDIDM